ncbi:hypothetical protein CEE36_03180 [candidate division TA06 bacterium B3_TA06]|uniref:Uncharacterized protein n=1 Tax=candidate division TA06 bacterium B3_TA06 TaxID=2012487 RepID=A0A532V918_UNCT6|nr:MAG: hypothetical protein CEE36_03180 [candidate division TA06 bacterium B3_TA06]
MRLPPKVTCRLFELIGLQLAKLVHCDGQFPNLKDNPKIDGDGFYKLLDLVISYTPQPGLSIPLDQHSLESQTYTLHLSIIEAHSSIACIQTNLQFRICSLQFELSDTLVHRGR